MTEYDNTNSGVMFPPYPDQRLVLQGKIDIEGNEQRIICIRQPLKKDGDAVLVVYKQAGILYPNDKKGNDKAPEYSGPIDDRADLRWAGWKGEKNGNHYLSLRVSNKENPDSEPSHRGGPVANNPVVDDEIPF